MRFWSARPFLRIALALMAGIVLFELDIPLPGVGYAFVAGCIGYLFVWRFFQSATSGPTRQLTGSLATLLVVLHGYLLTGLHTESGREDHLLHIGEEVAGYQAVVVSEADRRDGAFKAVLSIEQVRTAQGWQPATGKVMAWLKTEGQQGERPLYGTRLLLNGAPREVSPPINPGEFDYQRFLRRKNIWHQHFAEPGMWQAIGYDPPWAVLALSFRLRRAGEELFNRLLEDPAVQSVAVALVLGIRERLAEDLRDAYAAAGAMHVLAVSGLHVGIIFQLFTLLLGPLRNLKGGRWLFLFSSLLILWLFALVSGFSPSVLRAALMFSLVAIARAFRRDTNIYNTIGLTAFILLCAEPYMLFQAGFQLSFAAVLGIVYFHPLLNNWWELRHPLLRYAWSLAAVTIAAQLATTPITLYYFQQFPVYFLPANLLVVPLAVGAVYVGVITLLLGWLATISGEWLFFLAEMAACVFEWGLILLNTIVQFFHYLPGSLAAGVYVSGPEAWLLYGLLGCLAALFAYRRLYWAGLSLAVVLLFSGIRVGRWYAAARTTPYLISFHIGGQPNIAYVEGNQAWLVVLPDLLTEPERWQRKAMGYFHQRGIVKVHTLAPEPGRIVQANGLQVLQPEGTEEDFLIVAGKLRVGVLDGDATAITKVPADWWVVNRRSLNAAVRHLPAVAHAGVYWAESFRSDHHQQGLSRLAERVKEVRTLSESGLLRISLPQSGLSDQ